MGELFKRINSRDALIAIVVLAFTGSTVRDRVSDEENAETITAQVAKLRESNARIEVLMTTVEQRLDRIEAAQDRR